MSEPNIGDIRDQLVNIQLALTRTLAMIDVIQTAYGVAEEMEDDLPDDEPMLKSPECSVCDEPADDRAQTRNVMGRNDSIWICSHCLTLISDYRYQHLNPDGCCPECETQLIQYSRVIWSP